LYRPQRTSNMKAPLQITAQLLMLQGVKLHGWLEHACNSLAVLHGSTSAGGRTAQPCSKQGLLPAQGGEHAQSGR